MYRMETRRLPVLCAGIRPGDKVVDVCSAPGGKAMHALLCLKGEGSLSARDKTVSKVKKIEENFGRLKFQNVSCKVWDATKSDEAFFSQADVVLCDVPCSGIGIIGLANRKSNTMHCNMPKSSLQFSERL